MSTASICAFAVSPGDFEDIADMLVPELTRRGRYKQAYAKGTLREKLFGAGRARLAAPHPAGKYRVNVARMSAATRGVAAATGPRMSLRSSGLRKARQRLRSISMPRPGPSGTRTSRL